MNVNNINEVIFWIENVLGQTIVDRDTLTNSEYFYLEDGKIIHYGEWGGYDIEISYDTWKSLDEYITSEETGSGWEHCRPDYEKRTFNMDEVRSQINNHLAKSDGKEFKETFMMPLYLEPQEANALQVALQSIEEYYLTEQDRESIAREVRVLDKCRHKLTRTKYNCPHWVFYKTTILLKSEIEASAEIYIAENDIISLELLNSQASLQLKMFEAFKIKDK